MGCLIELKFCEVSRNSVSNRCWKFQLSILKNKTVLFLKKILSKIDQYNSIRWRLLSLFSVTVLVWASPVINNKSQGHSFDWIFTTSNMKSLVVLSLLNYQWTSHKPMYSPFISPLGNMLANLNYFYTECLYFFYIKWFGSRTMGLLPRAH